MLLNIKRLTMEEARKKIAAIDSLDDVAFSDLENTGLYMT